MKVKMLTSMAGERITRNVGDEVEIGEGEAARLINAGFAEALENKAIIKEPKVIIKKKKKKKKKKK